MLTILTHCNNCGGLEILYTRTFLEISIKQLIRMFLVIKLIRVSLELIDNSLIIPFELDRVESGHDQDDLFDCSVTKQFVFNRFINRNHSKGSFSFCFRTFITQFIWSRAPEDGFTKSQSVQGRTMTPDSGYHDINFELTKYFRV